MIKTKNKELDSFWSEGLKPGGLIVIAARPAMGKKSFLFLIGNQISQQHKTLLISMGDSALNLKKYKISDSILIDDSPAINVEQLAEIISQNKPAVVLIDYIQLMTGNRENLLQDLKTLAVNSNTCLIVNSQISPELENRIISDRRPIISDLTAVGTLFNSANIPYIDHLTFFYRDQYYNSNSQLPDTIELIQYKKGNKNIIELDWKSLV
jgi:replicative DNA helicase